MPRDPWQITREMFLDEEETQRLLRFLARMQRASARQDRVVAATDRLILETLLFSGLRNSEFCALRVRDTVVGTGCSTIEVCGTPRQDRTVWVPQMLSQHIVRFVEQVRPELLPEEVDPEDASQPLVFNERGNPYERTALYRRVKRILSEAGFAERASVQLLRHTYGYLAYKRTGGNLLFTQRQLGHAHPMVTAVYAQFVDEPYEELADRVGGLDSTPSATTGRRRSPQRKHRNRTKT